jgi:hypothetical protein
MPNARPTQPGYYWACVWYQWTIVRVEEVMPSGRLLIAQFGVGDFEEPAEVLEWGPAIPEYRGEGGG